MKADKAILLQLAAHRGADSHPITENPIIMWAGEGISTGLIKAQGP